MFIWNSPHQGITFLFLFLFLRKKIEVGALLNTNSLTETKTGTLKQKTDNINKGDHYNDTYQPISLIYESNPDNAVFVRAAPAPTASAAATAAASTIVPDAHIPPPG